MTNLPHNIEDLICLRELRLDDNEFEFIPVQVYWLESLEELGLSNNKIGHISPDEIGKNEVLYLGFLYEANAGISQMISNQW